MKKFLKAKDTQAAIAACPALTVDGAAAIYLFTCESPLYHQLNEKLRARNRAELKVRGIDTCELKGKASDSAVKRVLS